MGYTPDKESISLAAEAGSIKILKYLLEEDGVDPDATTCHLLHIIIAANQGQLELVKLLLADKRVDVAGSVASCYGDNHEIVRALLADNRVDPSEEGFNVLQHATAKRRVKIITLLWEAISREHVEIVKLLLVDLRTDSASLGNVYLEKAIREIVGLLLANPGVDVNISSEVLLNAARLCADTEIEKMLLSALQERNN